jgi:protein-S-isoprenylcysteine O-methyltransferase Ste14
MGGEGLPHIISGRWDIAAANILFFMLFLLFLRYRRKTDWRSYGMYSAFIIALFAEMYGFPLTAYFVANYFGAVPVEYKPAVELSINVFGVGFALPTMMLVGSALTISGLVLVVLGWYQIYSSEEGLVTGGVYRLARHPQYTGILLVTFGWILHWPTLLTLLMWPVLAASYFLLAKEEEDELRKKFPEEFREYSKETPMFI